MQIQFNPHLPPGYLETHELNGVSWRSERPVRETLAERTVARTVRRFERESRWEMEQQRRDRVCGTIQKEYRVGEITLRMARYPWERIPRVSIVKEREERTGER